ncbi:related to SPC3 - signal peptidase subunit [Pseudozyma flocculosa]|nr:related to SPC3 - signal peptidase subunit [Pseudozyma flocculosa]
MSTPRRNPTGSVAIKSLETVSGRAIWHMDRRTQDYIVTSFDIQANFTDLFRWNTKQVFVSLVAEYQDAKNQSNSVVIWDRILRTPSSAYVDLQDEQNKYGFREVSKSFGGIDTTRFTLKWNVMPKVGQLHYGNEFASSALKIPSKVVEVPASSAEGGAASSPKKVKQKVRQMYY